MNLSFHVQRLHLHIMKSW